MQLRRTLRRLPLTRADRLLDVVKFLRQYAIWLHNHLLVVKHLLYLQGNNFLDVLLLRHLLNNKLLHLAHLSEDLLVLQYLLALYVRLAL